jgi:predicted esterase
MNVLSIETPTHGRVLYEPRSPDRLLVGFHGYAELAETHLDELHKIEGTADWSLASVQSLNRFYTRAGEVVGNWMTKLDREQAIADNIEYVRRVITALPPAKTLVFIGFSQGASMAARAAAAIRCGGLIMLGGDVPPDVKAEDLPPMLLSRGTKDEWYNDEKFKKDLSFVGHRAKPLVFEGGHEWSDAFRAAATAFLNGIEERRTQSAE